MRNPHFDDNRLIWTDSYAGQYAPPVYAEQFDLQWKLALEGNEEYYRNPGASVDDAYIDDRVYEWTGRHPAGLNRFADPTMASRVLDHPIDPALIRGRKCVDIGCGLGRWTRTMQRIGAAEVTSIDISASAIESVSRFNDRVIRGNIMELPAEHPELVGQFEFGNFWGVAMCTHNPLQAFLNAASLIGRDGSLYLMVYAPEGMHNTHIANVMRRKFNALKTVEDRLRFVDAVYERRWDWDYPLRDNLKNLAKRVLNRPKGSKVGWLDLLEPYYNWTIPRDVIEGWFDKAGFRTVTFLNETEHPKVAHHALGARSR